MQTGFIDNLNAKFAKPAQDPQEAHRPLSSAVDLFNIFSWEATRTLQQDFTLRFNNTWYQVTKTIPLAVRPKQKITVRTHLDGSLSFHYQNKPLAVKPLGQDKPKPATALHCTQTPSVASSKQPHKNTASPWRRFNPGWLKNKPKGDISISH